ncbi:hypothetical protein H920_03503 [Fukomys damarensis]|uniref:Uncharacterized protein n=1 Tax=Fukomys damarensis TaxID=885580 RepID=A0A091DXT2_FUKDA|nr:hypothetical protein H920_03503 [Fukomys damarensis]
MSREVYAARLARGVGADRSVPGARSYRSFSGRPSPLTQGRRDERSASALAQRQRAGVVPVLSVALDSEIKKENGSADLKTPRRHSLPTASPVTGGAGNSGGVPHPRGESCSFPTKASGRATQSPPAAPGPGSRTS